MDNLTLINSLEKTASDLEFAAQNIKKASSEDVREIDNYSTFLDGVLSGLGLESSRG